LNRGILPIANKMTAPEISPIANVPKTMAQNDDMNPAMPVCAGAVSGMGVGAGEGCVIGEITGDGPDTDCGRHVMTAVRVQDISGRFASIVALSQLAVIFAVKIR
jgi:hypothetical protein